MYDNYVKVAVVFTYGYSLKTWDMNGTLLKEIKPYQILNKEYDVEFIFVTYGNAEDKNYNLDIEGIKVIPIYEYLKFSKSKILNYIKSLYIPFLLKENLKEIDIIKQNQLLGSWVSIILKKLLKKPLFIRTGYDMYEFSILENKSWHIKRLYQLLTFWSLKLADLYTVTSKCDLNFLISKFGFDKIKIRPNWVEKNRYLDFHKRHQKKIISIGRLENQKNFSYLIDSFKNSDYEIDLIGSGTLKSEIIQFAIDNNVRVNIIERISNSELIKLLQNYRYFISTSYYEGNPKSVLEALSSGCIVFLSNIKNHKELIDDGVNGFIFENNNNLIDVFNKNIQNNLETISKNAYDHVQKSNSINKLVLSEYNDLLNLLNRR